MSGNDVKTALSAEVEKKAENLLAQIETRIKTGVAEYLPGAVAPISAEIEAVKKSSLSLEERIKVIEGIQRKLDEEHAAQKSFEQLTYQEIFQDAKTWRHKKGIDQPGSGRLFIAFLNSISNAVDGRMAEKQLCDFEAKHGVQLPELKTTFQAMGNTKSILSIGSPQEAGFIVPTPLTMEYIEALYARTFFAKVGVRKLAMPYGNLKMPRVGAKSTATYTGEAAPVASTNPKFEVINWTARKLGGLISYTRDLFFAAPIGLEAIIIDDMSRVMNLKKEYTALYGTGVSGIPQGLDTISGISKTGSTSTPLTNMIPAQIIAARESTNIEPNFGWVMHPQAYWYIANLKTTTGAFIFKDEMMLKGTLLGYPIARTTQALFTDTGTYATSSVDIWFGNWSELILAQFRDMEVTVSDQGTFVDDTGATISAIQYDLMLIRFIDQHDFNVRHTEAFSKNTYKLAES